MKVVVSLAEMGSKSPVGIRFVGKIVEYGVPAGKAPLSPIRGKGELPVNAPGVAEKSPLRCAA